ncbi:MAG: hypothetical protein A2252_02845 [Elusimicrobia bacterium RIFOXYA2_FULL_39_19]|nr:MAG: hypothetical protein A2252_02845 [Elusimicrobia bacterium RIFOXYA2_FULL_39_19]
MNKKTIIWIVVGLVICMVSFRIVTSKGKAKASDTDSSKPVYTQKVAWGTMRTSINASGNITAYVQADIFSRVPGKLIQNLVDDGSYVRDNQEIALVDRDEIGTSFTTATVKSTLSGILLKHYFEPGQKVNPAMPVATVGRIDKVKAVINIPEGDFLKIKRGFKAIITVDAYPDRKFYGEITMLGAQIDMLNRTGQAEITLDNSDNQLKPGMFAGVEIGLASRSGLIVPINVIIDDGNTKKVFVVENNLAKERIIKTGMTDDSNAEVLSGLKSGEELITDGQRKLKNDDPVRVIVE